MRILSVHRKLSVLKRCPNEEVRLYSCNNQFPWRMPFQANLILMVNMEITGYI